MAQLKRMKKCTYCGKEYLDEATVCAIDGEPLARIGPKIPVGALDGELHNQQLEALLNKPHFLADPVFPKGNYLQVLG